MDILIDGSGAGPDNSQYEILRGFRICPSDADDYFCPQVHYKTDICLVCKWNCCMDCQRTRPFLVGGSKRLCLVGRLPVGVFGPGLPNEKYRIFKFS